jgi:hypothetical protein
MRFYNYLRKTGIKFIGDDEFIPVDGRIREKLNAREDHDRNFGEVVKDLVKK